VPLVAVLPFDAVTGDEGTRLLAKGLTQDVITDLGRSPEFGVLSSGATAGYGENADPRKAGAELKAAFVVEGSIARDAARMRVTAQLVDAATGRGLWSDRWDRPAAGFFAMQTEIAETIAARLGGVVQVAGRNAARRKPPGSLTAYELCLLGVERIEKNTVPDAQEAIVLLNRAIEIDPGFARPWIALSWAHTILADHGISQPRNRAAAREAAERALALDPGDAHAHNAAGWQIGVTGDLARAKAEYDIALQLAPNDVGVLLGYASWASGFGEPERGAAMVDRIRRLQPNSPPTLSSQFAYAYFMAGRNEEALAMIDRLAVENYFLDTWAYKAGALAALGRLEEARAVSRQASDAQPDISIEYLFGNS
jgi:TolB-like protein